MPRTHLERPLQQDICAYLAAHGWVHSPNSSGYDARRALYPTDVLAIQYTFVELHDDGSPGLSPNSTDEDIPNYTAPNPQMPRSSRTTCASFWAVFV